ncbi:Short-chain dehydrogenase/reductase SDR [Penicillium expansum]|uniref:Short-chain dehydrogenase/reductase SDR n=1 Tax=Penicillium expansum TaxID=27334 RepID=A0A0A2JIT4_PENEN|nr:Short-chain dehydrogenase/reductase SDR [Penicillium expansum]KGO38832.1 Short-chain dehydrogenase/reductase SDR [Penicillium expansum]KGO54711.1 Short-chain dehydrogenase/reductase SDR [Penicillium expansum]KGO67342.1 Short-chain dehydrogenase/reductase SDR [Penicillium expansum]
MATASQKIVLITGGNQGIGYETAKNLLRTSASYHVILGSRKLSNGEEAVKKLQAETDLKGTVSTIELDVTEDKSVDAAAEKVAADYGRLDILVNNAGIVSLANPPSRVEYRKVLDTNVVGSLSMTEAFLDLLRKSEERRLVFVSSSVGSVSQAADPTSKYYSGNGFEYRSSKAALNMLIVLYWNSLQKEGFKVHGADPGLCGTNFTGNAQSLLDRGAATPAQGGERIATVVKGEKDADVGRVLGEYGVSPW